MARIDIAPSTAVHQSYPADIKAPLQDGTKAKPAASKAHVPTTFADEKAAIRKLADSTVRPRSSDASQKLKRASTRASLHGSESSVSLNSSSSDSRTGSISEGSSVELASRGSSSSLDSESGLTPPPVYKSTATIPLPPFESEPASPTTEDPLLEMRITAEPEKITTPLERPSSGPYMNVPKTAGAAPSRTYRAASAVASALSPRDPHADFGHHQHLASMNLFAGIETKVLPRELFEDIGPAVVNFDNRLKSAMGRTAKNEAMVDEMRMKAYADLKESAADAQSAVLAFDEGLVGKTISPEEMKGHEQTVKALCEKITHAQETRLSQKAQNDWNQHTVKNQVLRDSQAKFAGKMAFKGGKLAVSATSVALDPTGLSIAAGIYTAVQMSQLVREFTKTRNSALHALQKRDAALEKQFEAAQAAEKAGQGPASLSGVRSALHKVEGAGKELIGSTHIPFVGKAIGATLHEQEEELTGFVAKSASLDVKAHECREKLQGVLEQISQARQAGGLSERDEAFIKEAEADVDKMVKDLFALRDEVRNDHKIAEAYEEQCKRFRGGQPSKTEGASHAVGKAALGLDLSYIGYSAAKFAKLASYVGV